MSGRVTEPAGPGPRTMQRARAASAQAAPSKWRYWMNRWAAQPPALEARAMGPRAPPPFPAPSSRRCCMLKPASGVRKPGRSPRRARFGAHVPAGRRRRPAGVAPGGRPGHTNPCLAVHPRSLGTPRRRVQRRISADRPSLPACTRPHPQARRESGAAAAAATAPARPAGPGAALSWDLCVPAASVRGAWQGRGRRRRAWQGGAGRGASHDACPRCPGPFLRSPDPIGKPHSRPGSQSRLPVPAHTPCAHASAR